jgi:hypothetical protein
MIQHVLRRLQNQRQLSAHQAGKNSKWTKYIPWSRRRLLAVVLLLSSYLEIYYCGDLS